MAKKINNFKSLFKKKPKVSKLLNMYTYVIVVNNGFGEQTMTKLREFGSNVQVSCLGQGTANKEVLNMLGVEGNRKDVILAFADENNVKTIGKELNKFFAQNKRFMGIGFTLKISSIVGEKIYHFLTNTL